MDMAVPISPYPCTASGQLRKMERIQIMDNVTGNYTSAKTVITVKTVFDGKQSGLPENVSRLQTGKD